MVTDVGRVSCVLASAKGRGASGGRKPPEASERDHPKTIARRARDDAHAGQHVLFLDPVGARNSATARWLDMSPLNRLN